MPIPLPVDDRERIERLRTLCPDLGSEQTDATLQSLVELAATLCNTPTALVSLVGEDTQYFRARTGLKAAQTGRDVSFCTWAIMDDAPFVVPDATEDERFVGNPLVTGDPHIRFYAGIPLITTDRRFRLGTVCVIDQRPRTLTSDQIEALSRLADSVVSIIEQEHHLLDSALQTEGVLDSIAECVVATDTDGIVTYANPAAERLVGSDCIGQPASQALPFELDGAPLAAHPVSAALAQQSVTSIPDGTTMQIHDGSVANIADQAAPIFDARGELRGAVIVFRDVTVERSLSLQLAWQGTHDGLTGLLNRSAFEARLLESLADTGPSGSVLYLDLDRFKGVNDELGHAVGDELLIRVASALSASTDEADLVARIGGDEFAVLLRGSGREAAQEIAADILRAFRAIRASFVDKRATIDASIGIIDLDDPSLTIEEILHRADSACYVAKNSGGGRIQVYDPSFDEIEAWNGSVRWMNSLQNAIAADRLQLHAQRIVPLSNGTRPAFEVLVRLVEDGELVRPNLFMAAAERFRLTRQLDRWVVNETLHQLARANASQDFSAVHINLSGQTLGDATMAAEIRQRIEASSVPPDLLCFEITESNAVADLWGASEFIKTLTDIGCRFALDDFGRGFSSFEYLRRFDVSVVKIDGSFVTDLANDTTTRHMLEAIVTVCDALEKTTIAEWVDSESTLELLRTLGVDGAQGNFISEPMPLEELLAEAG